MTLFLIWTGPCCLVIIGVIFEHNPNRMRTIIQDVPEITHASLAWALVWWTLSITLFHIGTKLYGTVDENRAHQREMAMLGLDHRQPRLVRLALRLGLLSVICWTGLVLAAYRLGIGVLGQAVPNVAVPVRIVLSRGPVLASCATYATYAMLRSQRARLVILGGALIPIGLSTYTTTSRGSALVFLLPFLIFEFCSTTSIRTRRRVLAVVALVLCMVVVLFPLISARRASLGFGGGSASGSGVDFTTSALQLALRPQGAIGSLYMTKGYISDRPSFQPTQVTNDYTVKVVEVRTPNDFRSPGIVAGLYLLAGPLGVALGMLALGFVVQAAFASARGRPLGDAAITFLAVRGLVFLSEGTLQVQDLLVFALAFLGILLLGRLMLAIANGAWVSEPIPVMARTGALP
jgi:hypothetical protein